MQSCRLYFRWEKSWLAENLITLTLNCTKLQTYTNGDLKISQYVCV